MKIEEVDKNFKLENVTEPDIEWHEITEDVFDVYGVYFKDGKFLRYPEELGATINEYVHWHASNTAGGRVRFETDSPYIAVKIDAGYWGLMNNMNIMGLAGASIYTDGYFSKSIYPDIGKCIHYENKKEMSFDGIYKIARPHVPFENHDITVYMPLYNSVHKIYIGIKKGSRIKESKKYTNEKPIFFYGSSITQGGCASHAGNDYVSLVCKMLDSDFINLGISGQAKGQRIMAEYIASIDASIYVLDYDYNAPDAGYLERTHYPFYKTIREMRKDTPIVLITQPNTDYCETTEVRRRIIYDTYKRAKDEGDKNVYFIDGDTLFCDDLRDCCTVDGCHPNDLGFYCMAKAIYPTLNKIIISKERL